MSRRKKAEHQAKQITAAREGAKKAAAKRREEALKEEAEELRRYEADLAKATKVSLGTADAEPDAMAAQTRPPLHQLRWMPIYGPQGVPPLQETANGRRTPPRG